MNNCTLKEFFLHLEVERVAFNKVYKPKILNGVKLMKKKVPVAFLFFFIFLVSTPYAFSTNYYVNGSTGSDGYDGLYETYQGGSNGPWKTIGKAASAVPSGSHTINVTEGTYAERVTITASGIDSNNLLHYKANGTAICRGFELNGNYVKVEGFTCTSPFCDLTDGVGIRIRGNYCIALNNVCQDCPDGGIALESTANNCTVKGNTIVRCGVKGIAVLGGTNHHIENNDISDIRAKIGTCLLAVEANGVHFHGVGHVFIGNYIHNIISANQSGYHPHIDAFQTWDDGPPIGAATNCTFEKNHIDMLYQAPTQEDCAHGWMLEESTNIIIKNNIVKVYSGVNTGGGGNSNLTLVNNTFINDLTLNTAFWPTGVGISNLSNCKVKNNIFYDQDYKAWEAKGTNPGLDVDYNCMYRSDGKTPNGVQKPHDLWGINPLFVNVGQDDYHLQSNSPCIDAGITLSGVTDDYDGNPRPRGAAFDIGAYEYKPSISRPVGLRIVN
jgi:parallel beta-helix repeat protein